MPIPTFSGAAFGTLGYTGITGNAALDSTTVFLPGTNGVVISNIVVKDSLGNPITNYTAVVADSEQTGLSESRAWGTVGGAYV